MRHTRRSGTWELDAPEAEDFREPVEVGVAVEHGEAAMFSGGCGDQCVGQRHAMGAVAALGEFADRAHRSVGNGAIVA